MSQKRDFLGISLFLSDTAPPSNEPCVRLLSAEAPVLLDMKNRCPVTSEESGEGRMLRTAAGSAPLQLASYFRVNVFKIKASK